MARFWSAFVAVLLLAVAASPVAAQPKGAPLTLDKGGWIDDPKLQRAAPASMAIVAEKELKDLYKAWKLGAPPAIDFGKEIVIVITAKGDGVFFVSGGGGNGNVQVELTGAPKDKPGFAYHLATHPKDGVRSVNNKPLPAPKQ